MSKHIEDADSLQEPGHVAAPVSTGTSPPRDRLVNKATTLLATRADDPAGVTATLAAAHGLDTDAAGDIVAESLRTLEGGPQAREGLHRTDAGNATRLVNYFGDRIRYVYEHRRWLAWDGTRWAPDATGAVERYAKETVLRIYGEASTTADDDERQKLAKWAVQSESAGRLDAMMRLARSDARIVVREDDLDSNPWSLNVANGTVNLQTGELAPHDSADMHSKVAGAAYDAGVAAPRWAAFLERVLPDAEVREFVHKLAGYSIAGDVGENVLPFPYGPGANGKSVFLGVLREVLGDYATEAAPDLLVARRERGIPTDIADLRGYRFVTTTEVEGGRPMASDVMKRITGESRLKARKMRQDFESFRNVTKLWMAANDRPQVDGLDEAIWRRVRLIPFEVTIPAAERDPQLASKLLEERDAILEWLIAGCLAYQSEGLSPPPAVMAATDDYRADSNPLADWADSELELGDAETFASNAALRASYEQHCRWARVEQVPQRSRKWREGLRRLGCSEQRNASARGWAGVALRDHGGADL